MTSNHNSTNLFAPCTRSARLLSLLGPAYRSLLAVRAPVLPSKDPSLINCTVPDFRSTTGLFTSLRQEHNLKGSGKHLFDASVYKDDSSTSSFHEMVRNMSKMTKSAKPTTFHHMLATLAQEDRLLRLYTQNVDGIDTGLEPLSTTVPLKKNAAGKWPKTVQLHGGLDKMVCSKCGETSDFDADLFDGPVPPVCETCVELDRLRTDVAGKRSHGIGRLRPRMVLYNEHNPDDEAIGAVTREDLRKRPDAVVVVGTSLKIPGVKRIVREMCATVRDRRDGVTVWINNDPEPVGKEFEDCWDIVVRGSCDEVARHAAMRHWYEPEDLQEPTEEEWNRAKDKTVEVIINKTFKPVAATERFKRAMPSPEFSPITSRVMTTDLISDSFTEEDELILTPPTPSKSVKTSPKKTKVSAFDKLNKTDKKTSTTTKKSKASNVKFVKKAGSAAKTAQGKTTTTATKKNTTTKPQAKISQTFKQTKAVSAAGKTVKDKKSSTAKSEEAAMRPVPAKDSRINTSPAKAPSFPGLSNWQSPKKIVSRITVESLIQGEGVI